MSKEKFFDIKDTMFFIYFPLVSVIGMFTPRCPSAVFGGFFHQLGTDIIVILTLFLKDVLTSLIEQPPLLFSEVLLRGKGL
jgi:hypothetical protein